MVKAKRIRRFEKRTKCYRQNKIFMTDVKKFDQGIRKQSIEMKEPPSIKEVQKFWKKIWSNEKEHNK